MKTSELFEESISDFLKRSRDPLRRDNTGTPRSDSDLLKFHQDSLVKMGDSAPKSHRQYHERWISKLQKRMKLAK